MDREKEVEKLSLENKQYLEQIKKRKNGCCNVF